MAKGGQTDYHVPDMDEPSIDVQEEFNPDTDGPKRPGRKTRGEALKKVDKQARRLAGHISIVKEDLKGVTDRQVSDALVALLGEQKASEADAWGLARDKDLFAKLVEEIRKTSAGRRAQGSEESKARREEEKQFLLDNWNAMPVSLRRKMVNGLVLGHADREGMLKALFGELGVTGFEEARKASTSKAPIARGVKK